MKTYKIPHTDLHASRLAYGCMNIGRRWDATSITADERKAAIEAVAAAFDASIYMHGRSEEIFAEALAELRVPRKDVNIQSKYGIRCSGAPIRGAPGRYDFSPTARAGLCQAPRSGPTVPGYCAAIPTRRSFNRRMRA